MDSTTIINYSKLFPLKSISDVVNFFRLQLEHVEPDLTLLSIVVGFIEHSLTSGRIQESGPTAPNVEILNNFPVLTFDIVCNLYKQFSQILSVIDKPKATVKGAANRQVIKKVSDIIWHSLIRSSYKDRAHLQNLYSYLSGSRLDCFGVAFAVVAGCQLLGYKDVHLAISEDHAWVVFGKNCVETIEVTWHGKGHEDKRGQDVSVGYESRCWLYLAGYPVICDRYVEVAAIVSAINISLTPSSDCLELANLQQNLLWLLYDMGHLQKYPMGLGNLGELEEVSHTQKRPSCEKIYEEAIKSAQEHYNNYHVYPYTYQGSYYYRQNKYQEAFKSWANAGDVIRMYNYSRDDEEIYKEFLEIANEFIPHIMKTESSGHSAKCILRNPECFANLLRFYDGICQWEEGSSTPILHIGWAKPLVNTISKFEYDIRSQVVINVPTDESETFSFNNTRKNEYNDNKNQIPSEMIINKDHKLEEMDLNEGNNNCLKKEQRDKSSSASEINKKSDVPTLADLTAACGEKILNPDFLLQGGGQPFAEHKEKQLDDDLLIERQSRNSCVSSLSRKPFNSSSGNMGAENETQGNTKLKCKKIASTEKEPSTSSSSLTDNLDLNAKCVIALYSQKMKGLKDLLLAEKLNTHAISLQVTAQSHFISGRKLRGGNSDKSILNSSCNVYNDVEVHVRPKRIRKE